MEVSKLCKALATVSAIRESLYQHILWLEKVFPDSFFIDGFKYHHDKLREAEADLCKGLGWKIERLSAGTKYDTPQMLPDDHYLNSKEAVPF